MLFANTKADEEGQNKFAANINITLESTPADLNSYVSGAKDTLSKVLQNYQFVDSRDVTVGSNQAKLISGTFIQGVFHLKNFQLIVVKNGKAYITTATVLESTLDQYKNLAESSLLTFKLN